MQEFIVRRHEWLQAQLQANRDPWTPAFATIFAADGVLQTEHRRLWSKMESLLTLYQRQHDALAEIGWLIAKRRRYLAEISRKDTDAYVVYSTE